MSTEQQLTPWFDGSVKPVRKGVYERFGEGWGLSDFALWDGRRWMCGHETPEGADSLVMWESMFQPHHGDTDFQWRGLTKEQK
jgi:hypothetical protein